jgi:hypothetical protein
VNQLDVTGTALLGAPQAWRARPFGSAVLDLDIVVDGADRAGMVTSLLAACLADADGRAIDADEAWQWTLNQRLQALLAMRLAAGDAAIELQATCMQCGEAMAIGLDLRAFAGEPATPRFTWHDDDAVAVELRLPSGRDLQRWQRDGVEAAETMAAALIDAVAGAPVGPNYRAPTSWLPALDDAFAAHDPLTALQLQATCPACAHDNAIACDLEALLLAGFARTHARLLDDVVRLASAFHWTEAEILALPRWRRAHYLRQLDAGAWA